MNQNNIFRSIMLCTLLVFLGGSWQIASGAQLSPEAAAILYVAPGGDCAGTSPCYDSPQAAVDAAQSGDMIRIAAGSYLPPPGATQVLHITKSVILQGGFRPTNWYDMQPFAFPAVLDASHLGSVVTLAGAPSEPIDVPLDGIQIKNGQSTLGGGMSATDALLTMKRCIVSDNQSSSSAAEFT